MAKRRRREYLVYLDDAKAAAESAIDSFNRVNHSYRNEATPLLLANAWEKLAKAILVHAKQSIKQGQRGDTISAEKAVHRLQNRKDLERNQVEIVQQIVSLRNAAAHEHLPLVPEEIMHHLLYFGCKIFRTAVATTFPSHAKGMEKNFLSLSFADLTTYADKVQKLVSGVRKSGADRRLVWLLDRGIEFDGTQYTTEKQFEAKYRDKKRIMPYLAINNFVKSANMVRIVPVEASRNYAADVTLRKGSARDPTLPVVVQKTDVEDDYPYLTKELALNLGVSVSAIVEAARRNNMKGDPKYHQEVRTSKSGSVHRYSEAAKSRFKSELGLGDGA